MKRLKKKVDFTGMSDAEIEKLQKESLKKETCLGRARWLTWFFGMFSLLAGAILSIISKANINVDIIALVGLSGSVGLSIGETIFKRKYYACKNELDYRKMKEKEQQKQEAQQVEVEAVVEKTTEEIKAEEKKAKEEKVSSLIKRLQLLKESEKCVQEEIGKLNSELENLSSENEKQDTNDMTK